MEPPKSDNDKANEAMGGLIVLILIAVAGYFGWQWMSGILGEFLVSLFEPGIIFLLIFTFLTGYFLGWAYLSWVLNIIAIIVIVFIQAKIFFNVDYIQRLSYIGQTGADGGVVGSIFMTHMVIHPTMLLLWIWLGRAARRFDIRTRTEAVEQMSPADFKHQLDKLGSLPELAVAGWFAARWNRMDGEQRLGWINDHIAELRRLWLDGDESGFEKYQTNLPALMAEIDGDGLASAETPTPPNPVIPDDGGDKWSDEKLLPQFFCAQLNLLSIDEAFEKSSWLNDRWRTMDPDEQLDWATHNQESLRKLWEQGGDLGFKRHGPTLMHTLARLDVITLSEKASTQLENLETILEKRTPS